MKTLLIAATVVLSGCVGLGPHKSGVDQAQGWAQQVKVTKDPYKNVTKYQGPSLMLASGTGADIVSVFFRMTRDANGQGDPQLYIRSSYEDQWRMYQSANTIDGKSHPTVSIAREGLSCRHRCNYSEDVGVSFTMMELTGYIATGLSLKISGSGGDQVLEVPWAFVWAFVMATPN